MMVQGLSSLSFLHCWNKSESFSSRGLNCSPVNKKNKNIPTSALVDTPFTSFSNPLLFLLALFSNYFSLCNHQVLLSFQSPPHQSSLFISLSTFDFSSLIGLTFFFVTLLAPLLYLLTVLFHITMPSHHLYCGSCGYEYIILLGCLLPRLLSTFLNFYNCSHLFHTYSTQIDII